MAVNGPVDVPEVGVPNIGGRGKRTVTTVVIIVLVAAVVGLAVALVHKGHTTGIAAVVKSTTTTTGVCPPGPPAGTVCATSPGFSSTRKGTATTTSTPSEADQVYAECSDPNSTGIKFTDSNGNSATASFCGYFTTGEDASGNSAPAGYSFDNVVISLADDQTDRSADLGDITGSLYLESQTTSCSHPANTASPDGCYPFDETGEGSLPEGLWMYSETGAIAPASLPIQISPGSSQVYFISVLVPTSASAPTGVYDLSYSDGANDVPSGFNAAIGPELSGSLFPAP